MSPLSDLNVLIAAAAGSYLMGGEKGLVWGLMFGALLNIFRS